jgi:hypothetical protein
MMTLNPRVSRLLCVLPIVLVAIGGTGQERRARLDGIAKEGSQPVAGVLAVVNDYETVWQMKTDEHGAFSFFVPSGCYDMLLSSPFFKPKVKRFCVSSGEVKKLSIRLTRASAVRLPLS